MDTGKPGEVLDMKSLEEDGEPGKKRVSRKLEKLKEAGESPGEI